MPLHLSRNKGLSLKEWGISVQVQLSVCNGNPLLQIGDHSLQEVSHWEGDPGHSLLQTSRSQRVSLRTPVYRDAKLLILVISKFPSWLQSELGGYWNVLWEVQQRKYYSTCSVICAEKVSRLLSRKQELVRQQKLWEQTGFLINSRGDNWCC